MTDEIDETGMTAEILVRIINEDGVTISVMSAPVTVNESYIAFNAVEAHRRRQKIKLVEND